MRISDWSSDVCSSDLDLRLRQAGDPGRTGEPLAAGGSRAWRPWSQHHGVLQGLQCGHPEHGAGHPAAGGHHSLLGSLVLLRYQAAAGELVPATGRTCGTDRTRVVEGTSEAVRVTPCERSGIK